MCTDTFIIIVHYNNFVPLQTSALSAIISDVKDDTRYAQVQSFYEDLGTLAMEKGYVQLTYWCVAQCKHS